MKFMQKQGSQLINIGTFVLLMFLVSLVRGTDGYSRVDLIGMGVIGLVVGIIFYLIAAFMRQDQET